MENKDILVQKKCSFCDGGGKVAEDGFDGEIITCPVCNGSGTVNVAADTVLHVVCQGRGSIRMKGGMGKQNVMCPGCRGSGWYAPPGF